MRTLARAESGLVLMLVLVVFLFVELVVVGGLSLVMSDLQGAVAGQLAMQSLSVAEAGVNYGVAQLVERAALATDQEYAGEPEDIALPGANGRPLGTFSVTVACVYPRDSQPPACLDDPGTTDVDERDLRLIRSTGFIPARAARARRQIEVTVRRYVPAQGDIGVFGICGRDRVVLGPDTSLIGDVGSNAEVTVDGPKQPPTVAGRVPAAPSLAPLAEAVAPEGRPGLSGLYTWRVSFVGSRGRESGGSPPTPVLLLTDQHGALTNIPVGGPTIVRRRIYRTAGDSPQGPWFLVGEIPENTSREHTDGQPDNSLRWRIPGAVEGRIAAAGDVACSEGCDRQVEGSVRARLREVVCPNFLAPPSQPGSKPAPDPIVQTAAQQTMSWSSLHVEDGRAVTIETLSAPQAQLHIHLSDIVLEREAQLVITGPGTVYFHVSGTFTLGEGAVFGAIDFDGHLVTPADRVHVLMSGRDPNFFGTSTASIRWNGANRVAGVVFAPNVNVVIDRAAAFHGGLFARYVRISRSSGIFLDPTEGLGSEKSIIRPSPFQYILRWYDNPYPGAPAP